LETTKENIELGEDSLFTQISSNGKTIQKTKDFLDNTFSQITAFSGKIADSIKNLDATPDEFEFEFAVKFSDDAGIIISSVSSEASITIKLKWTKS
jgi:hypothetical protein